MKRNAFRTTALATGVCLFLNACGGSGGGGGSNGNGNGNGNGNSGAITLTGVVAIGQALGNAAVSVACATGSGTATADATTGHYSATLGSGAALPCVLTATSSDGVTTLHSVVTSGTVANVTPLTELLIAEVTGALPSALTAAQVSSGFTATAVASGQTAVLNLLKDAGIDTTNVGDVLTGSLTIGSGGSSYDGALDALYAALGTGGSTLASLTTTVVAQAAGAGSSTETASTLLAPELLLKAKSPTCDALRSGSYSMVVSGDSYPIRQVSVDAAAGQLQIDSHYGPDTVPLTANGTCRYTASGGALDLVVAPSGVLVARVSNDDGTFALGVAVPRQTHTLDELAGTWNSIISDTNDDNTNTAAGSWIFGYAQFAINGTSAQTTQGCVYPVGSDTAQCAPADFSLPPATTLALADSGYSVVRHDASTTNGPWTDKLFAYQAGNGSWLVLAANISGSSATVTAEDGSGDGSIGFSTRKHTLSLPTVSSTFSASWNVYLDTATQLSTVATDTTTLRVTGTDTGANSFTRLVSQDGGATTHEDTLFINNPYDGFEFRDLATGVATSDGGTTTVRRTFYLKTGVGVSVNLMPVTSASSTSRLNVSVSQPTP